MEIVGSRRNKSVDNTKEISTEELRNGYMSVTTYPDCVVGVRKDYEVIMQTKPDRFLVKEPRTK